MSPHGPPAPAGAGPSALYEDEDAPPNAEKATEWTVLLGGDWSFSDLPQLPRLYVNVYMPLLLFGEQKGDGGRVGSEFSFGENIAQGRGGAWRVLMRHITEATPANDRPELQRLQVASPGSLTMKVDPSVAAVLAEVVERSSAESKTWFRELWKERHPKKRDRPFDPWDEEDQDHDPEQDGTELDPRISPDQLDKLGKRLCPFVGLSWTLVNNAFRKPHLRADFILAYYRMVERLRTFVDKGLIEAL
ncbi:MAG TPA: hypothetical protein ENJ18_08625 [Nannocystis exedens]|nr:hypothetical protein [Nannocystis exedens]